ncbi:hypothetical protein HH303_12340 [Rhodospirillaceae bacterium KN72]|uniref:Parvulin-like PPIase n=1 Tax=Pacificispira spongiicola TaxID=2729598 RepID=A0A7Y0E181_9PROT|nr:peptidylprolyl isomerase [Pacificispira spongiicola]NMM45273.1 hypothetical protein [Pacificispira spongiicola]
MRRMSLRHLAAAAAIAVSAAGAMTSAVSAQAQDPDTTVAKVNGETVTAGEVATFFAGLPREVQQTGLQPVYPLVLDEVIGRKLIVEKARATGVADSAEVQERLAQLEAELIYQFYLTQESKARVDDAAVRAAYDQWVSEQPVEEEVNVSHILVDTEEEATEIIQLVTDGTPFADLAKERSKDPGSKDNGGSYGWQRKGTFVKPFEEAAFSLEPNTFTSEPVKTQFGYHVILVSDRREVAPPAFEEVADQFRQNLAEDKIREIVEEAIAAAEIERFDMQGNPLPDSGN